MAIVERVVTISRMARRKPYFSRRAPSAAEAGPCTHLRNRPHTRHCPGPLARPRQFLNLSRISSNRSSKDF